MKVFSPRNVMVAVLVILIAAILIVFMSGFTDFGKKAEEEQLNAVRALVERAVVQCYALEGSYPPNLEYLRSYGVVPNYDHYIYNYEVVGANVFPIIEINPIK